MNITDEKRRNRQSNKGSNIKIKNEKQKMQ